MPNRKITCRGRNGFFMLDRVEITSYPSRMKNDREVSLNLYSVRDGDSPPILIRGPVETMPALLRGLLEAVEEIERADDIDHHTGQRSFDWIKSVFGWTGELPED
jgi:hypothetical protein